MKAKPAEDISYEVVRSNRATADIVIERDGRVLVRAPESIPDERIEDIVEAKRYWITRTSPSGAISTPLVCCANIETVKASSIWAAPTDYRSSQTRKNLCC